MSPSSTVQEHLTMQAPVQLFRRFYAGLCAVSVLGTLLALVPSAGAAVYELEQCTPARPGYSGWVPGYSGNYVYFGENCVQPGGALTVAFEASVPHDNGNYVGWEFTPPADTSIASISVENRDFRSGASHPAGFGDASVVVIRNGTQTIDDCTRVFGCTTISGAKTYPLDGADKFWFGLQCTGANGCPADDTHARFSGIRTRLNDEANPTLTSTSGSLRSTETTTRIRQMFFTATDEGGGVYRRRLVVDDQPQPPATVSTNNGSCATPFNARVPCPLSVSSQFDVDTATLTDGSHDIALRVTDATDQNVVQSSTWTIKVDNQPPTVDVPTITGDPSEGQTLTCNSNVSGQSPSIAHQWLRANGDGSSAASIAGATGATYTVTGADVGHKLICRVTATDGGGSTARDSSITQEPFSSGRLVSRAATATASSLGTAGTVRFVVSKETLTFARRRARWTGSAFTARGRLTDAAGQPVRGLTLQISQTVNDRKRQLGTATSSADGSWSFRIPRGPNRTITIAVGDALNAATTTIRQRVSAHVTFRTVHKRIRRGGGVLFRGTLHGGHLNTREKLIEFQVHYRGAWQTIGTLRTDRKGRFSVRYRFGAAAYGRYAFRVRTLPTLRYPVAVGTSRGKAATVRVG